MVQMTRYYDPKGSGLRSVFTWKATVFELVLKRKEFWWYIWWNLCLTSAVIFGVPDNQIEQFNWDAASVMQYVMTFFVTFYNDMCFKRYETLYPEVAAFTDGVIDFTQELIVICGPQELTLHKIACVKYLLAVVYEHFMLVCGGRLRKDQWKELVDKGLLTEQEIAVLKYFPGGRVSTVLTSWVLFILRDALVQDCMWRYMPNDKREAVSQQTVHIYNRFARHVVNMEKCCNKIGYMIGNPVPFSYYHLMNFILLFNILMLATFSALYKSYASVFPFGLALLIYNGLREVSTALAEPFGEDAVDFTCPDIMRNCFDRTLCLLLAFQRQESREWVLKQISQVEELEERHLRRSCKKTVITETNAPGSEQKGSPATHCRWTNDSLFELSDAETDMKRKLLYSLDVKGAPKIIPVVEEVIDVDVRRTTAEDKADAEQERGQALLLELDDLEFDHGRLELILEELAFKFPELLDYPLKVEERRVDPKLGGREVTYIEMCELLVEQFPDRVLSEKMLDRHWAKLLTAEETREAAESEEEFGSDEENEEDEPLKNDPTKEVLSRAELTARHSRLRLNNPLSETYEPRREWSQPSRDFTGSGEPTQESTLLDVENTDLTANTKSSRS